MHKLNEIKELDCEEFDDEHEDFEELYQDFEELYEEMDLSKLKTVINNFIFKTALSYIKQEYKKQLKQQKKQFYDNTRITELKKYLESENKDTSVLDEYNIEDKKIINEIIEYTEKNYEFIERMQKISNSNNYYLLMKLLFIQLLEFDDNIDSFEEKRQMLEDKYKYNIIDDFDFDDDSCEVEAIIKFMEDKLSAILQENKSEKNKQYTRNYK